MGRLQGYLDKRGIAGPWRLEGALPDRPRAAVVIPALAEGEELLATLDSLDRCDPELRSCCAVVVVVNRCEKDGGDAAEVNRSDLQALAQRGRGLPHSPLAWVDASSEGSALPSRHAGVGLARKIGFDLLLGAMRESCLSIPLASLDADTRVAPDYLSALAIHFSAGRSRGCVIPFCHRSAPDPDGQEAIEAYELYLRAYVAGLAAAGSPYAFHTVGSAFACSGEAYLRAGGMNRRKAGEDFYFLQQLTKSSGVDSLGGTVVYPSPRVSRRTPFGTGRVVEKQLLGEVGVHYFAPEVFAVLRQWLVLAEGSQRLAGRELLRRAGEIDGQLAAYLETIGLVSSWDRLKGNFPGGDAFVRGFHAWFDGLRTLRLLRALESVWPRSSDPETVARQFEWSDSPARAVMLRRLRVQQGVRL